MLKTEYWQNHESGIMCEKNILLRWNESPEYIYKD